MNCQNCKQESLTDENGLCDMCAASAPAPVEAWKAAHSKHLAVHYPEYPVEKRAEMAARAADHFSRHSQGYSLDGAAIKATCKELGIKKTYTAIWEFFGAEKPAPVEKKPTMSKEAALGLARSAAAEKALAKQFRCVDGVIRTRKQIVEWYIERGAKLKDYGGEIGQVLEDRDNVHSSCIGKSGLAYAASILKQEA